MPSSHSLKAAFSLAAILGGLTLCATADAQNGLPACPIDLSMRWHNCWGTYTFPSGARYVGAWKDDKREGQGTLTWPTDERYVGEFRHDKRNGQGTNILSDGKKYIGGWNDDKANGYGTWYSPSGSLLVEGIWAEGKLTQQISVGAPSGYMVIGVAANDVLNVRSHPSSEASIVGMLKPETKQVQMLRSLGDWSLVRFGDLTGYVATRFLALDSRVDIFFADVALSPHAARVPNPKAPPTVVAPASPTAPKSSSGSAFRIANGQFVTNHHVVDGCTTLKINGNSGGRVVASDPARDLALVSIANDRGEVANIRTTRIQLNETVTAAGFPLDGTFTGIAITNGSISRLSGIGGDTGKVQISAPVQPGNSGGPLLDVAGNVIGVVSSRLDALKMVSKGSGIPQNVNFAIAGNALRGFLDAKNINYKEVGNQRELTGVQIAARASAFTVLIECRQ